MDEDTFTGRDDELATLVGAVRRASAGHGTTLLLEGAAGQGKSTLLARARQAAEREPFEVRWATGTCFSGSSEHDAFQPFAEALATLVNDDHDWRRSGRRLLTDLVVGVAPDLVRLVPGLGAIVDPVVKATSVAVRWWAEDEPSELAALARTLPAQFVDAFVAVARAHGPLVLVVEDAHWCDRSSADLVTRLAVAVRSEPVVVVVTCRSGVLAAEHPVQRALRDLRTRDQVTVISLADFTGPELRNYLGVRYDERVAEQLAGWLRRWCGGNPLFVSHYLTLLEGTGRLRREVAADGPSRWTLVGEVDELPTPDGVEAVLAQRIERLGDAERELMTLASVQGHEFLATVLADQLRAREQDLLSSLRRLETGVGLISELPGDDWVRDWSELYGFEHELMRQAFYRELSTRQRSLHHRAVGELMVERLETLPHAPRRMVLETAEHLELGRLWEAAGDQYRAAARSSYREGAFAEVQVLASRALKCFEEASSRQPSPGAWKGQARSVQLLLLASELAYWTVPDRIAGRGVDDLIARGVAAARSGGDERLATELQFLQAKLTLVDGRLSDAVRLYREVVARCREADDRLGEVIGSTELGHALAGTDLEESIAVQEHAHELLLSLDLGNSTALGPRAARHRHRLEATLGTALLDAGRLGESAEWFGRAQAGIERLGLPDVRSTTAPLHAQLLLALGDHDGARRLLEHEVAKLDASPAADLVAMHRAYLLALLGTSHLEHGDPAAAVPHLTEAWGAARGAHNTAVVPLVSTMYAALLIVPGTSAHDPASAEGVLLGVLHETRMTGYTRSEVAAQVLLARLNLQRGQPAPALAASGEAVRLLEEAGALPTVRREEVWFTHHRALVAAGRTDQAEGWLERARAEIGRKAASLPERDRGRFFRDVPLNRAVMSRLTPG